MNVYLKFILGVISCEVLALNGGQTMPDMLNGCYNAKRKVAADKCLEEYLLHVYGDKFNHILYKDALKWIDSLGRRSCIRLKGEVTGNRRLRVRRELRTLNHGQRNAFFNALKALKDDTSVWPNKYDAIALLHQCDAIPSGHGGPNFPAWHRYFLYILEEALRTKNRHVTLPYWDSTIDFRMSDPTQSIIWTELFLGNGKGVVYTGPFALWKTPSNKTLLRRDIAGVDSSLIDPVKIKNVFRKKYNRQILPPTSNNNLDNLEEHHNAVHRWVGGKDGHMSGLDTSPMDPVFFLHHCFVDYLWEKFRERQRKRDIDPETDYPAGPRTNQQPNRTMANLLPNRTSIWGYSNYFTQNVYRYADAPTCNNNCGKGHNAFLYCNETINACASRSRRHFEERRGFSSVPTDSIHFHSDHVGVSDSKEISLFLPEMNATITSANVAPNLPVIFPHSIIDQRTQ